MHILALDVGTPPVSPPSQGGDTRGVKAAVLDVASLAPVGPIAKTSYTLDHPEPDAAEVPAARLWSAVAAAARQATRGFESIEAVGLSCLTPALVLLDKADQPLAPIWTPLDRRSRSAAREIWETVGEEFLNTVGNRPLPGGISAVYWRQQLIQDPYLTHRVNSYLHVNGWLGLRLTGARAFDRANACLSGLYGTMAEQRWSERWCDYFRVDPSWLPPVVCGSTTLGTLRPEAAAELGVPAGVPVKLGTADTSSAMLAAGMGPGDLLHVVGTTQVLATMTSAPKPSPRRLTRQLGVGDAFIHVTYNPIGGPTLEWLRQLCYRDQSEQEFYERTVPAALERQTRVTLDPPHLGGDRLEIEACRAAFRDLTLASDRLDLLSALLEAMRRKHREALADLGMAEPWRRVFLTGDGAEVVRRLLPECAGAGMQLFEEGSLRGVARLFAPLFTKRP